MDYEPLQLVQIYFDTATFDEISRNAFTSLNNTYWCKKIYIGVTVDWCHFQGCEEHS